MTNFKNCTVCDLTWKDRESFLSDPDIELIGFQTNSDLLNKGLFLFNHLCGTTLSIQVKMFASLYKGLKFKNILIDTEQCQGYCLDESDLRPCGEECKFALGREIIQIIIKWQKGL
jgi:hypothetical protein